MMTGGMNTLEQYYFANDVWECYVCASCKVVLLERRKQRRNIICMLQLKLIECV